MSEHYTRADIERTNHWVIKLGSNVLLERPGLLDRPTFASLVRGVDALMRAGISVTIVSSGAVALGRQIMADRDDGSRSIPRLQALAALGQPHLLNLYDAEFSHYGRRVAQLLFTRGDLDDRKRYLNARYAIEEVRALGAIPIINENDTVATEELRFGDNDQLAAMTCGLVGADVLVILSDVDGVYEVDETQQTRRFTTRIPQIEARSERLDVLAGPSRSGVGTGGMVTKITAARIAARVGVPTIIAPGKRAGVLESLAAGEDVGTLLYPDGEQRAASGKKVWLGTSALAVGSLVCDGGAKRAVIERGASLLPVGITEVRGDFEEGSTVELLDKDGERFALGVSVYSSRAVTRLIGSTTDEIEQRLGYKLLDCAVHRDNLVCL
ncbi:MAG: glutamate 5-kinase [Myxococcota bacterium]|nr:glutamate 5-kinase [Myxococcota bacterium]